MLTNEAIVDIIGECTTLAERTEKNLILLAEQLEAKRGRGLYQAADAVEALDAAIDLLFKHKSALIRAKNSLKTKKTAQDWKVK